MELTLLEVHLDDASFTANAPFSDDSSAEEAESAAEATASTDDEGRAATDLIPFVLGLGALVGIAYLVRRLRGGDETGTEIEPEIAEPEAPTP